MSKITVKPSDIIVRLFLYVTPCIVPYNVLQGIKLRLFTKR